VRVEWPGECWNFGRKEGRSSPHCVMGSKDMLQEDRKLLIAFSLREFWEVIFVYRLRLHYWVRTLVYTYSISICIAGFLIT
jgi:hypothetical protein